MDTGFNEQIKRLEQEVKDLADKIRLAEDEAEFKKRQDLYRMSFLEDVGERVIESGMDDDGVLPTSKLDGKISVLQNEIENITSYVFQTENDGILILDAATYATATKAMKLGGGIFAIANEKDGEGGWTWRTFGTGAGFTADEITTGLLNAALVQVGSASSFEAGYNPAEALAAADAAQGTADGAAVAASDAQDDADTANSLLTDIANDSKLTPSEKQATKLQWDAIVGEEDGIDTLATTYGITTEKTTYDNTYTALNTYITPLLENLTTTSDIVGTTFRTKFSDYYDAKIALLNKISDTAKALADAAQYAAEVKMGVDSRCKALFHFDGSLNSHKGLTPTFARASVAYKQNGSEVAANVPRFEAGKFGQAYHGEEGTTNLLLYSEQFNNVVWTKNRGAVTPDDADAPNGTLTADKFITNDAAESWVSQDFTGTANIKNTFSVFVKKGNTDWCHVVFWDKGSNGCRQWFNINAGTTGDTTSFGAGYTIDHATITAIGVSGWYRITGTVTTNATTARQVRISPSDGNGQTNSAVGLYHWIWGAQVENKDYATSYMQTTSATATRSVEILTIPTAGVLNPQEGKISFYWIPINQPADTIVSQGTSPPILQVGNYYEDNSWVLWVTNEGLRLFVRGDGASDWTTSPFVIPNLDWYVLNQPVYFVIKWLNGDTFYVYVDGTKYGPYTSSLPLTGIAGDFLALGNYNVSGGKTNALYDELPIFDYAATDEEIAAWYASGSPFYASENQAQLPGYVKIESDGFKVYDSTGELRGIFGSWLNVVRKYGLKIINGEIYSTSFQTGVEGASNYIKLDVGDSPLEVVENNELALSVWSDNGEGFIQIYKDGDIVGQILPCDDVYGKGLRVQARGGSIGYTDLSLDAFRNINLSSGAANEIGMYTDKVWVWGDCFVNGTLDATNKLCVEKTSQGAVGLYTRESPEVKYIDEGCSELVNDECRVNLDPLFLECIEPRSSETPWLVQLTPKGKFTIYEAEIGESYFIVKSHEPGINGKFNWRISATRKDRVGVRFPRMEWLVGDEKDDSVLTSNWEDEFIGQ